MKPVLVARGLLLERKPGEARNAFKGRIGQARYDLYAKWMAKNLSSLADFELEAQLLAIRATKQKEKPGLLRQHHVKARARQLSQELAHRTEFGPDIFSARRKDLVELVASITERTNRLAEAAKKLNTREVVSPATSAPAAVDTTPADTPPAAARRRPVVVEIPAAGTAARGKRAADKRAPAAATSSRSAKTARETRPR